MSQALRDCIATGLTILGPVVAGWVLAVAVKVGRLLYTHLKNVWMRALLGILWHYAQIAVATVYQTSVKDLKDPSKPGEWTKLAAAAARQAAETFIRTAAADVLRQLQKGGEKTDLTVAQMIERAVVELKAQTKPRGPVQVEGTVSVRPPPLETVSPSEGVPL